MNFFSLDRYSTRKTATTRVSKCKYKLLYEYPVRCRPIFTANCSGVTLPFGAPLLIFCRPHKFFTVSKKKKKKKKKGRHFFFGFSYRLLAPCSFLYSQIFFSRRPNAKLADIWYILLLCQKIFRLKNCKFGNMPPP